MVKPEAPGEARSRSKVAERTCLPCTPRAVWKPSVDVTNTCTLGDAMSATQCAMCLQQEPMVG